MLFTPLQFFYQFFLEYGPSRKAISPQGPCQRKTFDEIVMGFSFQATIPTEILANKNTHANFLFGNWRGCSAEATDNLQQTTDNPLFVTAESSTAATRFQFWLIRIFKLYPNRRQMDVFP